VRGLEELSDDRRKIKIHSLKDYEGMRKAGKLAAQTLDYIEPFV